MPQTIDKATQILDLFSLTRPEWGVSEVARASELPKSTTRVLMSSLARRRILSRTDNDGTDWDGVCSNLARSSWNHRISGRSRKGDG
jgi:hypothetical protein